MGNPDFLLEHFQQKLALLDGIKNIVKGPPNPSPSKKEICQCHGLTHYVLTLFKFLECFLVIPFKIEPTELPNGLSEFHIVTSEWKTKFMQTVMFLITVYHIYLPIKILNNDGARFYSVIRAVIDFSLSCWCNMIVIILWKRRNTIIKIISRIDRVAKLLDGRTKSNLLILNSSKTFWLAASISLCCVILSILEVLVFSFGIERILNFRFFTILSGEASDMVSFAPDLELENYVFGQLLIVTLGLFQCLFNKTYYFYIGHFGYAILFIFSHVIWKLFQVLNTKVMMNSLEEIDEVLDSYVEIRKLLGMINRTFGSMMAWGIIAHLPYNAYKVKDLIDGTTSYQVSYIIHYIVYLGILVVAARVHAEVAIFVEKLTARVLVLNNNLLEARIMLIVQQAKTTGMKGNGLFMITYGFLGNIIGVVLTYAILIVQFQNN